MLAMAIDQVVGNTFHNRSWNLDSFKLLLGMEVLPVEKSKAKVMQLRRRARYYSPTICKSRQKGGAGELGLQADLTFSSGRLRGFTPGGSLSGESLFILWRSD
jgi:hypothetical protein